MNNPLDILKKYWSHNSFRPLQEEVINSIVNRQDTLVLLPTGGGKSLCFQIPALIQEGICIVVSPLIALMKDQVESLRRKGIKALVVHSGLSAGEVDAALDNAIYGDYKFLYLSPERLKTKMFRTRVQKMNVSFIAVDEAHCISQWGYDFRPDYLQIKEILEYTGKIPIIALTATATPEVTQDIMDNLGFENPLLIKGNFERDNLSYVVRYTEDKNGSLLKIAKSVIGSGIVYVRERKKAQEIADFLKSQGVFADSYHAGFSSKLRAAKQDDWMNGSTNVIVSTNAFGMGIDKGNVRFVCHFDMPESLEAYYQEAGRAGRDGKQSYAALLWNNYDIKRLRQIIRITFPDTEYLASIYQKLYRFFDIAYGHGSGLAVRFNLIDFSREYKLHAPTAYYAIKYLESEGILKLTEELDNPSRVMFIINRDALYGVQLKNDALDTLIKSLLRLYPGIFSSYVSIDEELIARTIRNSKAATTEMLIRLSQMKVITYIPGAKSPLLIFNQEREVEQGFYISKESYNKKLSSFSKRIESVISYSKESNKCRSGSLVEYFGQTEWKNCGICDICIGKKKQREAEGYEQQIERKLVELLIESPRTLDDLSLLINDETKCYLDILRDMADRGGIKVKGDTIILTNR